MDEINQVWSVVKLQPHIGRHLKALAAFQGKTMAGLVTELVEERLRQTPKAVAYLDSEKEKVERQMRKPQLRRLQQHSQTSNPAQQTLPTLDEDRE